MDSNISPGLAEVKARFGNPMIFLRLAHRFAGGELITDLFSNITNQTAYTMGILCFLSKTEN
jgi:hypothetical protein